MKKKVLLLAAVFATAVANAQVLQINATEKGLTADAADVAEGFELGSNDAIDLYIAFADQVKSTDCKGNGYNEAIFDGNSVFTKDGITGSNNPKDINGTGPGLSLEKPVSGFVLKMTAKQDGWAYFVGKMSSNKNYLVFEEGEPIGYKFWMEVNNERVADKVIIYEAKGEGEYNNIVDLAEVDWPIRRFLNDAEAAGAGNGIGVIGFPMVKDCTYLVCASGSKISVSGVYTSATEVASLIVKDADGNSLIFAGSESDAIENVTAAKENANAPIFNLAGQQVNKAYKGVVIQNGKKFIQK